MSEPAGLRLPFDSPWRRLPLEVVLAAALGALMLAAFLSVLGRAGRQAQAPLPIEAQLVVIPPEPKPVEIPKPVPKPAPKPEPKPVEQRPPIRHVRRKAPEPRAATPVQLPVEHAPSPPAPHGEPAAPVPSAVAPAPRAGSLAPEQMSARAILRPMPQIPDELRRHAFETVAVVRFAVAADGSAKATLVQPTSIPQLNVLLLEAFNRWRFFPALEAGKPIASVVELRVPVEVR
jgi:protein TonB